MAIHLDVAVARLWARWRDAHCDKHIMLGHEADGLTDVVGEGLLIEHQLIRRHRNEHGVGVLLRDAVVGPRHTRRGVAHDGLGEDMLARHLGQLLCHHIDVIDVGTHIDVVLADAFGHAAVSLLQLRLSRTEEVDKLLRIGLTATWPQTTASSAGKDKAIVIRSVYHWNRYN